MPALQLSYRLSMHLKTAPLSEEHRRSSAAAAATFAFAALSGVAAAVSV